MKMCNEIMCNKCVIINVSACVCNSIQIHSFKTRIVRSYVVHVYKNAAKETKSIRNTNNELLF